MSHPTSHKPGFYSSIFLLPKKDSQKLWLVFNMKVFNATYLEVPTHFWRTSISLLRTLIHPGNFVVSLDLQDVYMYGPIHWNSTSWCVSPCRRSPKRLFIPLSTASTSEIYWTVRFLAALRTYIVSLGCLHLRPILMRLELYFLT